MKGCLAYSFIMLLLTLRDRAVLFFNYVFPFLFFFIFAKSSRAEQGGVITQVVTLVLILAVLGNGLYGAGVRAVQERELNILRRFKVTPISPAPILMASMITGWIVFLPTALFTLVLANLLYGMPAPAHPFSLSVLITLGVVAFRAIGLIVAAVVNSAQESAILTQLLYLPMLFLSGAVFPITMLPDWAQVLVQLLPASYLSTAFQGILMRGESLAANWSAVIALAVTTVLATFLSMKLFRWEKEEKLPASAKLWVVVVLLPFIVLGSWQAYSRENVNKARLLYRDLRRSRTLLIRDARLFIGDGTLIPAGSVLVRNGAIAAVFESPPPDPDKLRAEVVEAAGKTLLPGLIDVRVHLVRSGGNGRFETDDAILRALASHLYCGTTAVRNVDDVDTAVQRALVRLQAGERLGAEVSTGDGGAVPVPALGPVEACMHLRQGNTDLLERSLVLQVGPTDLVRSVRRTMLGRESVSCDSDLEGARERLRRAYRSGVLLALGSGAGQPMTFHGPAIHRELQLWVESGIPPAVALQAASSNAARLLGAGDRIGLIRPGYEADLLLVDGNPLQDISATERISTVIFHGERVDRAELFEQD